MSLKAYDGMMTKEGFPYLQEKIKENISKFKEASLRKLGKTYAGIIQKHVDKELSILTYSRVFSLTKSEDEEIKNIEINDDTLLISYLFQVGKIAAKSEYLNYFTTHLTMTIEQKDDILLCYPGINVPEHKDILLTFLTDWYAQNQTDPDKNVPEDEWEKRCKDWDDFNETRGLQIVVKLFDPSHYWNNLIDFVRGEELYDLILPNIESDDKRRKNIWYLNFMEILMERNVKEEGFAKYLRSREYLNTEEGKLEYEKYKQDNPIELTPITTELLKTLKVK